MSRLNYADRFASSETLKERTVRKIFTAMIIAGANGECSKTAIKAIAAADIMMAEIDNSNDPTRNACEDK